MSLSFYLRKSAKSAFVFTFRIEVRKSYFFTLLNRLGKEFIDLRVEKDA